MQHDIDAVYNWCIDKRLTINLEKTKMSWCVSSQKKKKTASVSFNMGGRKLDIVDSYKYLGLSIDSLLNMENVYKNVNQKVNNRLFCLGKLRDNMSCDVAISIYKIMVLSLFDYACFAYEGTSHTNLAKLQRLQDRGLGICFKNHLKKFSNEDMHCISGVLYLKRRRQELLLSLMYKYSSSPTWVDRTPRLRTTRSVNKIRFNIRRHHSTLYAHSPLYRGCELWNQLGDWYQHSDTKFQFKQRLAMCPDLSKPSKNPTDEEMMDDSLVVIDTEGDDSDAISFNYTDS